MIWQIIYMKPHRRDKKSYVLEMIPMEYCVVGHILTALAKSYTL